MMTFLKLLAGVMLGGMLGAQSDNRQTNYLIGFMVAIAALITISIF